MATFGASLDVDALRGTYASAQPFRHVVIDDFFARDFALELAAAFPRFHAPQQVAARVFSGRAYGPPPARRAPIFADAFRALAGRAFAADLSRITGIDPLAMDETHAGAGVHVGLSGSTLPIHADHNTHPHAPWLYRRLNLLVYLNPEWDATWRANLLLYDAEGKRARKEIEPRFNRAVLMDVHDRAFHGYRPLRLPKGAARTSLATYFYSTAPSPFQDPAPHTTIASEPSDIGAFERLTTRMRARIVARAPWLLPRGTYEEKRHP